MNKQERDELREFILCNYPYEKTSTMPRFTGETVLELLDQIDALGLVVEAAREFVNHDGPSGSMGHVMLYSDLVTEVKALEWLEDED